MSASTKRVKQATFDEIQQLVRIAQVLKVRSRLLATDCFNAAGGKRSDPATGKAEWASRLAEDTESSLKECFNILADPDGAEREEQDSSARNEENHRKVC